MIRAGHLCLTLAVVLWAAALGRDRVDIWIDATDLPTLEIAQSIEVLDRDGTLLRAYTVADGRWRMGTDPASVDPTYLAMLIRYEDKRFRGHAGVDPLAMARAAAQALGRQEVVSGGSTLTMQVARLLEDSGTGRWSGKLRQIRVALALERQLSKDEILTLYLNLAPFGGNVEGVRAASFTWFGKPPERLTPAEAALLVALPQSPESRRPDRHPETALAARNRVLIRMVSDGVLEAETARAAMSEPMPDDRRPFPTLAPHLSDRLVAAGGPRVVRTTLDAGLQARIEDLAQAAVAQRTDRVQVAVMIADHQTGEILATVGSGAYAADRRGGFLDLTQAVRSPGSTLKPLVYALSFDNGLAHPETLIADRPMDFNGYRPQNFDGAYRGDIRVRDALQWSLNIPVVSLTEALGPEHVLAGLRRAGADPVLPGGRPGLAVSLGGVGMTLDDLVRLYAGLAQGGVAVDLRALPDPSDGFAPQRIVGEVAAWQVADILLQAPRPAGVQGAGIAFKTGTSYGHRDALAVGFDGRHVVAVWMGRADGTPVPGAFGADLAAPIMFEAFERLKPRIDPIPPPPPATLLLPTAQLPLPLQRFRPRGGQLDEGAPRIAFPPDGARIASGGLVARVSDGAGPFTWLANGVPVGTTHRREIQIDALGRGFSALTVIDAEGRSARAEIELLTP
ncbi:penicillin-binding protein 1C [Marivivens marinus]|uniref:penicillin-binding protein 1C n=1 Tax=Marivivens marinus TaxID=3110173 RepID=UPI003B84A8D9